MDQRTEGLLVVALMIALSLVFQVQMKLFASILGLFVEALRISVAQERSCGRGVWLARPLHCCAGRRAISSLAARSNSSGAVVRPASRLYRHRHYSARWRIVAGRRSELGQDIGARHHCRGYRPADRAMPAAPSAGRRPGVRGGSVARQWRKLANIRRFYDRLGAARFGAFGHTVRDVSVQLAPELDDLNEGFDLAIAKRLAPLRMATWFTTRNEMIGWLVQRFAAQTDRVLEIGCGTGYALCAWQSFADGPAVGQRKPTASACLMPVDARRGHRVLPDGCHT